MGIVAILLTIVDVATAHNVGLVSTVALVMALTDHVIARGKEDQSTI